MRFDARSSVSSEKLLEPAVPAPLMTEEFGTIGVGVIGGLIVVGVGVTDG